MGSFVDDFCDISGAKIHKNYSCVLSQTNIAKNSNKFYIMQIVTNGTDFWLYHRYGRIGDKGVISKTVCNPQYVAIQKFCSTFYSKTGNKWGDSPFQSKNGKYTMMDIEEPQIATDAEIPEVSEEKLPSQVDGLIRMISDKQLMTRTLQKLNIDVKKLPLGKIKKEQLAKADEILTMLKLYLAKEATPNLEEFGLSDTHSFKIERITEMSSTFWTLLPYSCGRQRPPLISTDKILGECADQLEGVRDIEISTKIIERGVTPKIIYDTLATKIAAIEPLSSEWMMLQAYVDSSQGATHDKTTLLEVFSIEKEFKDRSQIFSKTPNHMLLFHGSRSANYVGIFSEGLRIPNSAQVVNGAVLGSGIYFADCVTKSFNYCHDVIGLVLVCEVALGKEEKMSTASSRPLSQEFQSKMACGRYRPSKVVGWDKDPKVLIPLGKLEKDPTATYDCGFWYNEYVIYKKEQYRFRYLLKLKVERANY